MSASVMSTERDTVYGPLLTAVASGLTRGFAERLRDANRGTSFEGGRSSSGDDDKAGTPFAGVSRSF